ncbi:hypothetical protein [Paraburkholderia pallida]|nr:hypothetical protein [Paraburkholderia pallida]
MDESWLSMVFGFAVLVFAAMFVVAHYRREHRRARLLRRIDVTRHHLWF